MSDGFVPNIALSTFSQGPFLITNVLVSDGREGGRTAREPICSEDALKRTIFNFNGGAHLAVLIALCHPLSSGSQHIYPSGQRPQ